MTISNFNLKNYVTRIVVAVGILTGMVVLLLLFWAVIDVVLVVFGGILLGILLRNLSNWISKYTFLSNGWSLVTVGLVVIGLISLSIWLFAPSVAEQFDQLFERLPEAMGQIEEYLAQHELGRRMINGMPQGFELLSNRSGLLNQATGAFSSTLDMLTDLAIILFTGIYFAVNPSLYINGLLRLIPPGKRVRVHQVVNEVGHVLRWWLIGRLFSMTVVGVLTFIGVWLLGIPLALALGLFAAVVTFVPIIGPIISMVPAVLLALLQGPTMALYVVLLYLGIQLVESYFLTPLVQQEASSIPPAFTIIMQVIFGVLIGITGVVFATPVTAAILVIVNRLYVEDILNDSLTEQSK